VAMGAWLKSARAAVVSSPSVAAARSTRSTKRASAKPSASSDSPRERRDKLLIAPCPGGESPTSSAEPRPLIVLRRRQFRMAKTPLQDAEARRAVRVSERTTGCSASTSGHATPGLQEHAGTPSPRSQAWIEPSTVIEPIRRANELGRVARRQTASSSSKLTSGRRRLGQGPPASSPRAPGGRVVRAAKPALQAGRPAPVQSAHRRRLDVASATSEHRR